MAAAVPADAVHAANELAVPCSGIAPRITNVVATVDLRCKLDLYSIWCHAHNVIYDSKSTSQKVRMQLKEPKATAKIHPSGKMNIAGATSEDNAVKAAKLVARIVHRSQPQAGVKPVKARDVRIHNIVASCNVAFPNNLPRLHAAHPLVTKYEPQQFTGLHYYMRDLGLVLIIFGNGKVNITGAKTAAKVTTAFERIYPILQQFRLRESQLPNSGAKVDAAAGSIGGAATARQQEGSTGGSSGGSGLLFVGQQERSSSNGVAGVWQQQWGITGTATAAKHQQQQCSSNGPEAFEQQRWQQWQQQCGTNQPAAADVQQWQQWQLCVTPALGQRCWL